MLEKALKPLLPKFRKRNIPVVLIGGQASNIYGEPRLTQDIDLVIGVSLEGAEDLLAVVAEAGLKAITDSPLDFILTRFYLRTYDEKSKIVIDFLFSTSEYTKSIFNRSQTKQIGKTAIQVASKEDIIILKLQAGRGRDWDDIRGILLRNADVESSYIEHWLRKIDGEQETDYLIKYRDLVSSTVN